MTGSAYHAMDVFASCDSLYRVGVWGRDCGAVPLYQRLADCSKMLYIYTQNSLFGRSVLERFLDRFLDRFWEGSWIDFG